MSIGRRRRRRRRGWRQCRFQRHMLVEVLWRHVLPLTLGVAMVLLQVPIHGKGRRQDARRVNRRSLHGGRQRRSTGRKVGWRRRAGASSGHRRAKKNVLHSHCRWYPQDILTSYVNELCVPVSTKDQRNVLVCVSNQQGLVCVCRCQIGRNMSQFSLHAGIALSDSWGCWGG